MFLMLRGGGTAHNIVAVAAVAGMDRRSQEFARTITADLSRFRAGPLGALSLVGGEQRGARNAQYRVEAGVSQTGANLRADVTLLSGQDSKMLWTTSEQGPAASFVDLRQRAVAKLGQVLGCAVDVSSAGHRLKPDVLSLYLNGCALRATTSSSCPTRGSSASFVRSRSEHRPSRRVGRASRRSNRNPFPERRRPGARRCGMT